jgi:hypothetical protein
VALAAGFLASYIRAKGGSLGYGIEEGIVTPALRYGLVSPRLVLAWTSWAIWVVAIVTLLAAGVRASQVAKENDCERRGSGETRGDGRLLAYRVSSPRRMRLPEASGAAFSWSAGSRTDGSTAFARP